jgi:hypothetical protein
MCRQGIQGADAGLQAAEGSIETLSVEGGKRDLICRID